VTMDTSSVNLQGSSLEQLSLEEALHCVSSFLFPLHFSVFQFPAPSVFATLIHYRITIFALLLSAHFGCDAVCLLLVVWAVACNDARVGKLHSIWRQRAVDWLCLLLPSRIAFMN